MDVQNKSQVGVVCLLLWQMTAKCILKVGYATQIPLIVKIKLLLNVPKWFIVLCTNLT